MKLTKPLIWFDIESTGVSTSEDRIVELACIKVNRDGSKEEKTILVNPEVPIPLEASQVHGITNEDVKDKPTFKQYSQGVRDWFEGCDLGGYNSDNYDIHLLSAEFERAGLAGIDWEPHLFDVLKLYRHLFPNTLSDVYKRLTGKELEGAHGALADINATIEIADILTKDLQEQTVQEIDLVLQGDKKRFDLAGKLYKDQDEVIKYNFGKDRDKSVKNNPGFARWMLNQDFPQETKNEINHILKQ